MATALSSWSDCPPSYSGSNRDPSEITVDNGVFEVPSDTEDETAKGVQLLRDVDRFVVQRKIEDQERKFV